MLRITRTIAVPKQEIQMTAVRSKGPGGQNVNKVASAVHLRFDIKASSLPEDYKNKLLNLKDSRITKQGVVVIKAQQYKSREKNREAAVARLTALIKKAVIKKKKRRATKPTKGSQARRLDKKTKKGQIKKLRGRINRSGL